jgi:hypothetical protein
MTKAKAAAPHNNNINTIYIASEFLIIKLSEEYLQKETSFFDKMVSIPSIISNKTVLTG